MRSKKKSKLALTMEVGLQFCKDCCFHLKCEECVHLGLRQEYDKHLSKYGSPSCVAALLAKEEK